VIYFIYSSTFCSFFVVRQLFFFASFIFHLYLFSICLFAKNFITKHVHKCFTYCRLDIRKLVRTVIRINESSAICFLHTWPSSITRRFGLEIYPTTTILNNFDERCIGLCVRYLINASVHPE